MSSARLIRLYLAVGLFAVSLAGICDAQEQRPAGLLEAGVNYVDDVYSNAAVTAPVLITLTPAEQAAVYHCMVLVRGCALHDGSGAINMTPVGAGTNFPVWVDPYFGNYTMLGLLTEYSRSGRATDLATVREWLEWCAKIQAPGGYFEVFKGTVEAYSNTHTVDAWDSSAAMYLVVVRRFQQSGGIVSATMKQAALKALACIQSVTDKDGLTWATPTNQVKYFEDGIEVYSGLASANYFFSTLNMTTQSNQAAAQAKLIAAQLALFWNAKAGCFSTAKFANGTYQTSLSVLYPDVQVQLFGLGFVSPQSTVWTTVKAKFAPDDTLVNAAVGSERWSIAAYRMSSADNSIWRARLVNVVNSFNNNTYVYRPALAAAALYEGATFMPSPLTPATK